MSDRAITPMPGLGPEGPVMLVGGSFDPPHLAHVELAAQARARVCPSAQLVYVPAARSPHKAGGPEASGTDRVAMLKLALAGVERASVWTDELDRAGAGEPSYWVVTLERARSLLGTDRELLFLIGADQALGFARWREPGRILGLARAIVINRGEVRKQAELAQRLVGTPFQRELTSAWCEVEHLEISATGVREAISGGKDSDLRGVLHPEVASFIAERGLYRGSLHE